MNQARWVINRRLFAMLYLGFASGLPLALTGSTIQAWFTQAGVSLMTVGALTLIGLPYVWKFLWAPLMDKIVLPLGRRRGWILLTQGCLCVSILLLANMQPHTKATVMGLVALLVAFFSASQDVAIDAYRAEILLPTERGLGSAYFIFAYRMAVLVSGGLALILADYCGWHLTYQGMALLVVVLMIGTYFSPQPKEITLPKQGFIATIVEPFLNLLQRDQIMLLLLFIIFYKLGDALALSLMSNFLLHGLGFSLTEVGIAYKINSLIAGILGALIGGLLLTRKSLYFCLFWFGIMQAASTLLFALLASLGKQYFVMIIAIFAENFCSGMSAAAFLAFLMSLCNLRYTATQFAFMSAIASCGRIFLGPLAATMVTYLGWVNFYLWSFALSFPSLFLLYFMRNQVTQYANMATQN
ncbi:MAG: hypothetical protein A3E83_07450 [Gammaproteobacteria bacterium RIFCSPHIGHO2_12_FULL_41_20]|nr:MAG: hypothetical protein A3E83_07450 [Gammaproteobacteria bacterium RIFCSPHIGHO2_12_FULL_41_20]